MLWNATTLRGFAVEGLAGSVGNVVDLSFDEAWAVRALILEGGAALPITQVNKLDGPRRLVQAKQAEPLPVLALHEMSKLLALDLQATDGGVGPVRDVLFQDSDWQIKFFTADAGDGAGKVVLARDAVTAVDWEAGLVRLNIARKAVAASPRFEGDLGVDGAGADDHEARRSYFGVELVPPEKGPGLPD